MSAKKRNLVGSAIMQGERLRDEFTGSVYGAAALGYITYLYTLEATDALRERCPQVVVGRVKGSLSAMTKAFLLMRVNINLSLAQKNAEYWMADFGMAAYERVLPCVRRLQVAVANHLGRFKAVPDINALAMVVVAQSIASEAVRYVERRSRLLCGYTVTTRHGRTSVPFMLSQMSCATVCHHLTIISQETVGRCVPNDTDLLADPVIETGCKAVLNAMSDVDTWTYARDKANRLNKCEDDAQD